jgi:hypothetical protein
MNKAIDSGASQSLHEITAMPPFPEINVFPSRVPCRPDFTCLRLQKERKEMIMLLVDLLSLTMIGNPTMNGPF